MRLKDNDLKNGGNEDSDSKKESRAKKPWTPKCLNPACKLKHTLKECENTSAELKKTLLDAHHDKKKDDNAKKGKLGKTVVLQNPDGAADPKGVNGGWKVILGEVTSAIALDDIGVDYSCIPRSLVDKMKKAGAQIKETFLDKPVYLGAAIVDVSIKANSVFATHLTMYLNCGPLRLRSTEFLVVDDEMDEVLLGRPLLTMVGFDLDDHLNVNRSERRDTVASTDLFETLNSTAGKLARSSYTGLMHDSADVDPVVPLPTAGASMGVDNEQEITGALNTMLDRGKTAGMSKAGLENAREMLVENRDVFRINLGNDPSAKIPPLVVKLKPGAAPVKYTQRRYASAQRAFLSSTIQILEALGAVRANPTSQWASAALAVPKPGSEGYRFTVDLRSPSSRLSRF
jgi:hypothetical protein